MKPSPKWPNEINCFFAARMSSGDCPLEVTKLQLIAAGVLAQRNPLASDSLVSFPIPIHTEKFHLNAASVSV